MLSKNPFEFAHHESIVNSLYGSPSDPSFAFRISEELNTKIIDYLNKEGVKRTSPKSQLSEYQKTSSYLVLSGMSLSRLNALLENTHNHLSLSPSNNIVKDIQNYTRKKIAKYLKSPFAFVNARSWVTKPNSEPIEPNKLHRDGFPEGHLKVMIYPNGLNGNNGGFFMKDNGLLLNLPKGSAICFKNSDVKHCGIPGTQSDRLCIELTIQRTLVSCDQINESHCDGRHLKSPWLTYKLQEEAND